MGVALTTILLLNAQSLDNPDLETIFQNFPGPGLADAGERDFKPSKSFVWNEVPISVTLFLCRTTGYVGFTLTSVLILALYLLLFFRNRTTGHIIFTKKINWILFGVGFVPPLGLFLLTIVNPNPLEFNVFNSSAPFLHIIFMLACFGGFGVYELITIIGFGCSVCKNYPRQTLANWLLFGYWILCLIALGVSFVMSMTGALYQKLAVISVLLFKLGYCYVFHDLNMISLKEREPELAPWNPEIELPVVA